MRAFKRAVSAGTATSSPASATSSGISAMFATLVQNTRLSASWRRFLRTSLSARLVSATVFLKRSSSACCSALRICAPLAAPPCAFCSSCSLRLGLLQLVLQRLDLAEVFLLRLGLELAHHGERPERGGAAAQRDEVVAGGELLDHAHREGEVAVRRHHDAAAENILHVDRRAVGEQVDVGDEDHRVLGADSRSAGVPATGLSFSVKPSGNAVLNLPVRRTRERHGVARTA